MSTPLPSEKRFVDESKQEEMWVLRAQCADREALEMLLRSVQPPLRRYLRGLVGADADDVLQEALVLVFRKLKWLEFPDLFRPWAFRIASRAAFRHLRRERRFVHDERLLEDLPAPEGRPPDDLLRRLASDAAISPASRAVLLLHFQEEMTLPAVAVVLQVPLGTVKSRLAYGLATLRRQLGRKGGP